MDTTNVFDTLPNELIAKMCNDMDRNTLENFMFNYLRSYRICYDVLLQKVRELVTKYSVLSDESIATLNSEMYFNKIREKSRMSLNDYKFQKFLYYI